ncbi:hypothetical protein ACFPZL_01415 [Leucobacter soli]|nr:hypothetical protein [Leucobacter soli]
MKQRKTAVVALSGILAISLVVALAPSLALADEPSPEAPAEQTPSPPTPAAEATPQEPDTAAEQSEPRPEPLEVTAGGAETAKGGDLVSLSKPLTVRGSKTLGSSWSSVAITTQKSLPDALAGSVLVSVKASGAKKSGSVSIRAKGYTGSGAVVVSYRKTASATNLSLVKVGLGGAIQVRASAGSPKVLVKVLGWVPTTSALVVPEKAPLLAAVSVSKSTKTVKVAGISGIPKGAASVIVAVRTSKAKAGTLALSTRGASRPARGIGFATAGQTSFAVVTPDASGRISLSALSGKASVRLQVLGWSAGTTTLVAPARPTGGKLSSTSKKKITIAGTSGIPKSAKAVAVTLNAPKGWSVKIWANSRGTGTPLVSAVSTGAAQQVWVPVPKDRAIAVQAKAPKTKSKKKTNAVATTMFGGYIDAASADQMLSITPKAGTHLLSAGDVLAEREGGIIDLAASSGGAQVGDHLFVRSAQSAPYLGRVVASEALGNGRTRVTLQSINSLSESFDEYDAHFAGEIEDSQQVASPAASGSVVPGASAIPGMPGSIGMDFLESEHWNCGGSVDPREIISVGVAYEGSVNLDVSLSGRSIDFSSKGAISITFTFLGGASVSCTVSGEFPGGIPIPGTGLTIEFGGEGVVQVSNPSSEDGGSLSVTGGIRAYTGFYYIDGEKGGTGTANPFAVFRAADDREATAQLDLGLTTSVTIADVPFVPEPYEVEAGLTTGVSFRMEAPSPNDDPYHRTLRGPRCIDLTATPFVKFGAKVAIVLAPDITFELDPIEGDPRLLYAGPCIGYTGTVTTVISWPEAPTGSCTAEHCGLEQRIDRTMTKTLIGQAADFGRFYDWTSGPWGAPISQPYTWQYSQNDYAKWSHDPCWAGLGCGEILCQAETTSTGTGTVGWNPDNPTEAWFLNGYDSPNFATDRDGVPIGTVPQTVKTTPVSGDGGTYCPPDTTTSGVNPQMWSTAYFEGALNPLLITRPTINLTLTGMYSQWRPELTYTTTVNLVRHEYQR